MENQNETEFTKEKINNIKKAKEYLKNIFKEKEDLIDLKYYNKIYNTSINICKEEEEADLFITGISSLLFDIDNTEIFPNNLDNENLQKFLEECELDEDTAEYIIKVVKEIIEFKKSNFLNKPNSLEGKIIEDAIRLNQLSAIEIGKIFRDNTDKIYYKNNENENKENKSCIDKLNQIVFSIKDELNTKKGKEIGFNKIDFLLIFLKQFYKDIDEEDKVKFIDEIKEEVIKNKVKIYSKNVKKELFKMIETERENEEKRENFKNQILNPFERENIEKSFRKERGLVEKKILAKKKEIENKINEYEEKLRIKEELNNNEEL